VLFLSVTGVLLTYELQMLEFFEKKYVSSSEQQAPKSVEELVSVAQSVSGGKASSLVFDQREDRLIAIKAGRGQHSLLNPYSGESIENATTARGFFHTVTDLHRAFALGGDARGVGEAITGAANLVFLFLLLSGIYLWLPRMWRWGMLKTKMLFRRGLPNTQARDYNWHHVFSFWTFIPLFFIITTGLVFSYGWANKLVFIAAGQEPPVRRGPPRSGGGEPQTGGDVATFLPLDTLLNQARNHDDNWNRIVMDIPGETAPTVTFKLDSGSGRQPHKVKDVVLNRSTGEVEKIGLYSDRPLGSQARVYIRFLHTGESLGIVGQTIAGLASLAACFLVYTGLALAYRRLIVPALRKREQAKMAAAS